MSYRGWKVGDTCNGLDHGVKWIVARPGSIPVGDWIAGIANGTIVLVERADNGKIITWVKNTNPIFKEIEESFKSKARTQT